MKTMAQIAHLSATRLRREGDGRGRGEGEKNAEIPHCGRAPATLQIGYISATRNMTCHGTRTPRGAAELRSVGRSRDPAREATVSRTLDIMLSALCSGCSARDGCEGPLAARCEHTGGAEHVSGCAAECGHQVRHRSTPAGWPRQLGEAASIAMSGLRARTSAPVFRQCCEGMAGCEAPRGACVHCA